MNAVEAGVPMLLYGVQVVHGDNWITTDQRPVTMNEITRSLPAEEINRVVPVQSADQREIMAQHPARDRIPARVDNEDAKARRPGWSGLALAGSRGQLDDCAFLDFRPVL